MHAGGAVAGERAEEVVPAGDETQLELRVAVRGQELGSGRPGRADDAAGTEIRASAARSGSSLMP
jgi:hypothetical protein